MLVGFGLLAVLVTWPTATDFASRVPGAGAGDASGYLWDLAYNQKHGLHLWGTILQSDVSAPFGRVLPGSVNATLFTTLGPAWVLSELFSPIVAYNTMNLAGLALSGSAMYLAVRWLRLGVGPAIWAGVSLVLLPNELVRATGHLPLTHVECFPLMFMAGVHWLRAPGRGRALLLALALAFAWLSNPYYGVMCSIMLVVFGAWALVATWRRAGPVAAAARVGEAAAAAVVVVGIPLVALFLSTRDAVEGVFQRSETELLVYGAQLTDYVRPLGYNPIWQTVFQSPFPSPAGERMNYLGAATIVLGVIGIVAVLWRRTGLPPAIRQAGLVAVPMIPVLVAFSLASPQWIWGHRFTAPSRLVFEALPFLRVFARFVFPVMTVALIAGAIGLYALLRNRTQVTRIAVLLAVLLVTAVELPSPLPIGSAPPLAVNGLAPAQVPAWQWLRTHDRGEIVYEMPGTPNEALERYFMYGQTVHGHPITNGGLFPGQLGYDFASIAGVVNWPRVPAQLRSLGIDLVTVQPWAYAFVGAPAPDVRRPPAGYRVEAVLPDGSAIWRVTARPDDAVAVFRSGAGGWLGVEYRRRLGQRVWEWMGDRSRITVQARRPGDYTLATRVRTRVPGGTQRIEMTGPDGATRTITVRDGQRLSLPIRMDGTRGDVRFRNLGPAAAPIAPGDGRVVSLYMAQPEVTLAGP
ncbi:MAG: hypothetical protein AB7V42_13295 [Thermoleophilia bacterium]